MRLDRRTALKLLAALAPAASGLRQARTVLAATPELQWRHGLSLFGNLKYPVDFKHFDYVNPQAPKGGRVRIGAANSFNSLNPYTYKGDAAGLVSLTNDTLMTSAFDEPSTEYGLVAEAVQHPADFAFVTYRLRQAARFHDGTPMTPEDVVWSMESLRGSHPFYAAYYKNIRKAEQSGDREVRFEFTESGNRELPQIVGQLPVLAKHWWTGKDPNGRQRDVNATTLEPPLGSGPYRIANVRPGASITLTRVADYWAKDLPVNIGASNVDEITAIYFADETVMLEAFKGDAYDFRNENSAKNWATGYDVPAVRRGAIKREQVTLKNPEGMQCFCLNLRRAKFADPRVRLAFNHAFDFEWADANLFYGQYVRTASYFANSELAQSGLPSTGELAILEPLRSELPPEAFTTPYANPVNANAQQRRQNLLKARNLLAEAGWKVAADHILRNAAGEPMQVEFLLVSPTFERIVLPYVEQLKLLGVRSGVRTIDSAQYERRMQSFDFDIAVVSWPESLSPGNEQRNFWSSEAAGRQGSQNYAGIKNPVVDKLVDRIIFAKSRQELVDACRALDRVLLWNQYVVPMWHLPYERLAFWDRFGRPDPLPPYAVAFPTIWWWDAAKAAAIGGKT